MGERVGFWGEERLVRALADKVVGSWFVLSAKEEGGMLVGRPGLLVSGRRGAGEYRYVRGRSRMVR